MADGIELRTIDPAAGSAYIVVPTPPGVAEVSDDDLAPASGGTLAATIGASPFMVGGATPVAASVIIATIAFG